MHFLLFIFFALMVYVGIENFIHRTSYVAQNISNSIDEYEEDSDDQTNLNLQLTLRKNETLLGLLKKHHVKNSDTNNIIESLKVANKKVQPESKLILTLEPVDESNKSFAVRNIGILAPNNTSYLKIIKSGDAFSIEESIVTLIKQVVKTKAEIRSSGLFASLKSLDIPLNVVNEIIMAYSHQIDFQRQVKSGDFIELLIEKLSVEKEKFSHYGNVLCAKLNLSNQVYDIYRYSDSGNLGSYFSKEGKSFKRNLLKTPVKAARISSLFGNRKHPILGYHRMHKGIDFAAPTGTPIYSAGDGVITEMGTKAGYGRYIKVKHSSNLSTFYAHLSKFHKDMKLGYKIAQGKIIAYVGSSGSSTGPHLHYEVHINGRAVNPLSIKTMPDTALSADRLSKFKAMRKQLQNIDKFLDNNESYQFSSN